MVLLLKYAFFMSFLFAVSTGTPHMDGFSKEDSSYLPLDGKFEVVLELLIVCDMNFGAVFQNNQQKLLSYWESLLWDAHLRFLTVHNVSLSFQVNNIITLKEHEHKSIISNSMLAKSKLLESVALDAFGNWLYEQANSQNLIQYDVAILATGEEMTGTTFGISFSKSVCLVDTYLRRVGSAVAISMKHAHVPSTLVHEIGHLLGAPHDMKNEYQETNCEPFNATAHEFVMAYDGNHTLWEYFFSNCSQVSIQKVLRRKQADCLRRIDSDKLPLIDTSLVCGRQETMSLEDQCRVMVNDSRAFVVQEEFNCIQANCLLNLGPGIFSTNRSLDVFEGSECIKRGKHGRCFRGSCVTPGGILVNTDTGLCIGNEHASLINDSAVLRNCLNGKSLTPLDFVRMENLEAGGVLLKMLFSNITHNGTQDKCLTLRKNESSIIFVNCTANQSGLVWNLINAENLPETEKQFVLFHLDTMKCVVISKNSTRLETTSDCFGNDSYNHWRFFKESDIQKHVSCSSRITSRLFSSAENARQPMEMRSLVILLLTFYFVTFTVICGK